MQTRLMVKSVNRAVDIYIYRSAEWLIHLQVIVTSDLLVQWQHVSSCVGHYHVVDYGAGQITM